MNLPLVYRPEVRDEVVVLAIQHGKKHPQGWQSRV